MRSREARVGETSIRDPQHGFAEVALQGLDFNNLLVQGVTLLEMLLKAEQDRATSRGREMAQAGVAEAKIRTKRPKIYLSRPFCGVILDLKFSNLANKSKDMYRPTVAGSHLTLCQICNLMLLCLLCLFCLLCCDCGIIGGGCHDVLLVGVACCAGVSALLCCAFAVAFFFATFYVK